MVTINRILCPVDLSEFSLDALRHAMALAKWYAARVTVLSVYSGPQPILPGNAMPGNVALPPPFNPRSSLNTCASFASLYSEAQEGPLRSSPGR